MEFLAKIYTYSMERFGLAGVAYIVILGVLLLFIVAIMPED
jgi:hypothetical protein